MTEDVVTQAWLSRHAIAIPRAAGYYESSTAWVKVDNAGRISHAGLRDQTILSALISREKLTEDAQYYGFTYLDWRNAYFARIEAARYHDEARGSGTVWSKEDRYGKLIGTEQPYCIERRHMRYVEMMMRGTPLQKEQCAAEDNPTPFTDAFHRLRDAIDHIEDAARKEEDERRVKAQHARKR